MLTIRQAAIAACIASLAGAAQADVKVVQNLTIGNPQITAMLQSMDPVRRSQLAASGIGAFMTGAPVTTVTYTHGHLARVDIGTETIIVNTSSHKMTTLNRVTHTYTVAPYAPEVNAQMHAQIRATGQTKMIDNHKTRRYTILVKSAAMQGGQLSGDIWSAADLPQPAVSLLSSGPASGAAKDFRKIQGMPLIVNLTMSGSPLGNTTVRVTTSAISSHPLPATLFQIPHGYTKSSSATPAGMPSGFP